MSKSPITTHVLDTSVGKPAAGVTVILTQRDGNNWKFISEAVTNDDGRVATWPEWDAPLTAGTYQISFDIGSYYEEKEVDTFYPIASIVFEVKSPKEHYHVPLLLNPFGYSTYRGS